MCIARGIARFLSPSAAECRNSLSLSLLACRNCSPATTPPAQKLFHTLYSSRKAPYYPLPLLLAAVACTFFFFIRLFFCNFHASRVCAFNSTAWLLPSIVFFLSVSAREFFSLVEIVVYISKIFFFCRVWRIGRSCECVFKILLTWNNFVEFCSHFYCFWY